MADDYANPFGLYQNVNPVPENPFYSGMMAARNQMTAQPFIDQMQQSRQYDLMKKGMETGEFMGQEGVQQRSLQRQADMAKSRSVVNTQPELDQTTILEQQEKRRALPALTDAEIAKAEDVWRRAKSAPAREFLAEVGKLGEMLENVPEDQRPQAYQGVIRRFQMTNPNVKLPPQYMMYSPEILNEMRAIRFASVNTPEQIGKERIVGMQEDSKIVRQTQSDNTARDVATIRANADRYGADQARQRPTAAETRDRAIARLRRELNSTHKNDPDKLNEYKGYIDEKWNDQVTKRAALTLLEIEAITAADPKIKEQKMKEYNAVKKQFYADNGIYLNNKGEAVPPGTRRKLPDGTIIEFKGTGDPADMKKNWAPVKGK